MGERRVKVGDLVLIGHPRVTMPTDWFLAKVLWACTEDVAVEHTDLSGSELYRQVLTTDHVRAIGTISDLQDFKERCRTVVAKRQKRVRECERTLGRAREAVWEQIDELAKEGIALDHGGGGGYG